MKAIQENVQNLSAEYLKSLLGKAEFMALSFPTTEETVPFEKLYVSQTVMEEKGDERPEPDRPGKSTTSSNETLHQMAMGSVVEQVEVDLWQKLRQDHRVVVTAQAWTGKSTLCKWVVQHCHTTMHWLPIYIPFQSLSQSSHATLLSYLEQDYLPELGLEGVTVEGQHNEEHHTSSLSLARWLYDQWQAGQALLILDGADEEFERTKREAVLSALPTTDTRMTRPRVLLTSRPGGEVGGLGFEKIELQEFTRKQIETLINNCGVLLKAEEKTQKLLREMKAGTQPRAWQFAGRPGHLIQMVVTYVQEDVLLVWEEDQMDRIATRRFQISGRVAPKLKPDDPRLKRQLIEELAFHSLFCRKGHSQTRAQILDLLTHIIHAMQQYATTGYRPQQASRLLNDLFANSGFLKNTRQGLVEWESVPWLEFFAASHLAKKLEPDSGDSTLQRWAYSQPNEQSAITLPCTICQNTLPQFAHYLWRPEWQEMVILIGACLVDITTLLNRILQEPEDLFNTMISMYFSLLWRACKLPVKGMEQAFCRFKAVPFLITRGYKAENHIQFLRNLGPPKNRAVLNHEMEQEFTIALQDPRWWERLEAVSTLGSIGDPTVVPLLGMALHDPHEDVRRKAASALSTIGDAEALALLHTVLRDPELGVRGSVTSALGEIEDAEALVLLGTALQDPEWEVRKDAVSALGEMEDPEALTQLGIALQDPDWDIRRGVVSALGRIGNAAVVPLLEKALKDSEWMVREDAAEALGWLGNSIVVPLLDTALRDSKWEVRRSAASALGRIGDAMVVPLLDRALQDSESEVREAAVSALAGIEGTEALTPLGALLQDPEWKVRKKAASALARIGNADGLALLANMLQDSDWKVRLGVAETLGGLGDSIVVPLLDTALRDSKWEVREVAASALGRIGNAMVVPLLGKGLQDSQWEVRRNVTFSLGEIGDPTVLPLLGRALQDPVWIVREVAATALGKIGDATVVPLLRRALQDSHREVRIVTAEILGRMGDATVAPLLSVALRGPRRNGRALVKIIKTLYKCGLKNNIRILSDGRTEPLP